LGLSIVKRLVDAMQGQIECQSELGKGTAFTLRFPRARVEAPDPRMAFRALAAVETK
jgi:signal transduction histidine kinase